MNKRLPAKPKRGQRIGGAGVIYARYSSHNQKDLSIEQQVALDRQLADEHGIEIVEVYADRAMSGTNDQRPQFQRMMKDAEKGHINFVIAWKSSRIGRNMLEAMMNEVRLNELGVRILYVEEDFDDTAAGRFAARSMMNVNQFYSENMAEDIRRGLQSNADRCMITGSIPFGYRSEDAHYALDEEQAPIVLEIFERVANYEPLVQIAEDLNRRGIKTKSGGTWNKGSFHRMLANERYRGIYIYGETRVEGGIPRIVSDELFYRVQEAVKMNKQKRRNRSDETFLLTGKLFCGECGASMTGTSGTGKTGTVHQYYVCANQRNKGECTKKPVRKRETEEMIAQAVRDHILQPDVISWIADGVLELQASPEYNAELKLLRDQLDATTKSIRNIMTAIEQGIITPTTKDRLTELEEEQARTKANIALLQSQRVTLTRDHIVAWLESFRLGDIKSREYQAKVIDTFLEAAYLYDDGTFKIIFALPEGQRREIRIKDGKLLEDGNVIRGSFKLSSPPPMGSYANTPVLQLFENGVFVLTFKI